MLTYEKLGDDFVVIPALIYINKGLDTTINKQIIQKSSIEAIKFYSSGIKPKSLIITKTVGEFRVEGVPEEIYKAIFQ